MRYTSAERAIKKFSVKDAVKAAEIVLCGETMLCLDALKGKSESDRLTLVELNELSEKLVGDSRFYANKANRFREQDQDL